MMKLAAPVIALAVALTAVSIKGQVQTPPPAQPPAGAGDPAGGRAGGQGGRGNTAAMQFNEVCAACHGTYLNGGRAASLFGERFLSANDDDTLFRKITNGVPNTAMLPFKDTLTEAQIWQLIAYLRTQGANLKGKPVFVPDPNNRSSSPRSRPSRSRWSRPG
jgi:mono/diheme cytochrome c family protein